MSIFRTNSSATPLLKVVVPILLIILAAAGAYAMIKTAPRARKAERPVAVPMVETATFTRTTNPVTVSVMGTVIAAHEITLESQVAGSVVSVSDNFVPGGFFAQGEEVLRIDPQDYELALREVQAEVAQAQYDLKVEQGYQNVAGREWNLLKKSAKGTAQDAELALRKPHLAKAKADVEAAKAKLRQAQLDLERTGVTAPFPAMVETKSTDVGAMVSSQEALATLVGTDVFWVRVSVPVDRLGRITFPGPSSMDGSSASVLTGGDDPEYARQGTVVRLLPALESEGRMARVLIAVNDPLNLQGREGVKPLLLGSYVRVSIDGGVVSESFAIPRQAVHDNNRIWVLSADGRLDIREITPAWKGADTVLLTHGLEPDEQVVTSNISVPVEGMRLRGAGTETTEPRSVPNTRDMADGDDNA